MAYRICDRTGVSIRIPSQYEIPLPAEMWHGTPNTRGEFNLDSLATESNWTWDDCSNVINYLSRIYAATAELSSASLYKEGSDRVERLPPALVAQAEVNLNTFFSFSNYGGRSDLYEYLSSGAAAYIHRFCRNIVPLAVLEVETGYPCEPYIIHGLAEVVYPVVLPIVRHRIARGDTEQSD